MPQSDFQDIDRVLDRTLAGEATPQERERLRAWATAIGAPPEDVAALLRSPWVDAAALETGWMQLIGRLDGEHVQHRAPAPLTMSSRPMTRALHSAQRSTRWSYAAAAALAAIAVVVGIRFAHHAPTLSRAARTYTTAAGQYATLALADGSRVTLAPRTKAVVTDNGVERTITLVGEAHFDVVANARTPFLVHTGDVITRVLGTTFDVRRYANDVASRIVVQTGKVAVTSPRHPSPLTLTAGMTTQFADSVPVAMRVANADTSLYTDWTTGRLVFRDVPVPVLLATLTRWYGYEFRLSDSVLAARHVTGTFQIGETSRMMQLVKRVLHVTMTFDGAVVTLQPDDQADAAPQLPRNTTDESFHTTTEVGR